MKPDALLFDLDGLLLDTERFSKLAFDGASEEFNIGDHSDLFLSLVGTNEATHEERLTKALEDKIDVEAFRTNWIERFNQLLAVDTIGVLPGVVDVLNYAREAEIKCAVATSSGTEAAAHKLSDAGIADYFLTVTCGDQVQNSKPFPEIYLKAGASIDADMPRTVALEDSDNGVRAAHAANLTVIQIPNLVPASEELLATTGHTVCKDMFEVLDLLKADKLV